MRLEVLMEEMKHEFKAVAEGHGVILNEVRRVERTLAQRIDNTELAIRNLGGRVGNLEKGQEQILLRLGSVEIGLADVRGDIKKMGFRLGDLETRLN